MKKVYIVYALERYARRLKTTKPWKAAWYKLYLWIKYQRPICTDIKYTNDY